jgi:hypothetical protein
LPGHGFDLARPLGLQEDVVEVELGVLHDLDTQVVERLDRGVAGQEVLRPGAEGEDFQGLEPEQDTGHRYEAGDHRRDLLGRADGVFGDVGAELA